MKVLILGINGMIGSAIFNYLIDFSEFKIFGLIRDPNAINKFREKLLPNIILNTSKNIDDIEPIRIQLEKIKPDVVINCIGLVKQKLKFSSEIDMIAINSIFPHKLAKICSERNFKLIQVSTDCVFSGNNGNYTEVDNPDAIDFYGRSKCLGEVILERHLTIRTSVIGHEFESKSGLLEWFLSQKSCKGYKRAIFSGITSFELARIFKDIIIPRNQLSGLYHIAGDKIDKYTLLKIINDVYGVNVNIKPENGFKIDRSLSAEKFNSETNYQNQSWENQLIFMKDYTDSIILDFQR